MINVGVSVKNSMYVKNPARCSCKNGKYLGSIMDNSAIMCDEALQQYDEDKNYSKKL